MKEEFNLLISPFATRPDS